MITSTSSCDAKNARAPGWRLLCDALISAFSRFISVEDQAYLPANFRSGFSSGLLSRIMLIDVCDLPSIAATTLVVYSCPTNSSFSLSSAGLMLLSVVKP